MLVIHDEQLSRKLRRIAERENRPVEDVLNSMIIHYPREVSPEAAKPGKSEEVKNARRKVYNRARQYWLSIGDRVKAAMTDEELDEHFGRFDVEGIPRLKSELKSLDPPVGSLAYAAKIAEEGQFRSGRSDLASRSKEILNQHFAEDYLRRMRGEDAAE